MIVICFCMVTNNVGECYEPGDYKQMSRLPWCTPPTGIGSLGERQCRDVRNSYPGDIFATGEVPISCLPDKVSIYETGNAHNPNVYSTWGVVQPNEIRY